MANEQAVIDLLLQHQTRLVNRILALTKPESLEAVAEAENEMLPGGRSGPSVAARSRANAPPPVELQRPAHGEIQG